MSYDTLQTAYGDNMALRQQRDMKQAVLASMGAGSYADDRLGLTQLPFNSGGFGSSDPMDGNSMINTMKTLYALKAMDAQYSDATSTDRSDEVRVARENLILADTVEDEESSSSSVTSSSDKSEKKSESSPTATKEENTAAVEKAEEEYKKARSDFKDEKDRKGWIGSAWDGIKNTVGASSEKVKKEEIEGKGGIGHFFRKVVSKVIDSDNGSDAIQSKLDDTKKSIDAAKKDPKKVDELFSKTSSQVDTAEDIYIKGKKGEKLSDDEQALYDSVKSELDGKTSAEDVRKAIVKVATKDKSAAAMINDSEEGSMKISKKAAEYKASQAAGVDMTASIATGLIVAGGIAFAPVTGGASLALAIGAGAIIKPTIKATDTIGSSKSYGLGDFGTDAFSGSIDGLFAGIVPGAGSMATTGAAKVLGLQAVKTTVKEVGAEGVETAAKTAGKELIAKEVGKDAIYIAKDGVVKQASKKFWGGYARKQIGSFAKDGGVQVAKVGEKELGSVATDAAKGTVTVTEKAGLRSSFALKAPKGQSSTIEYVTNSEAKRLGGLLNKVDKTGAGRVFAAKTASASLVGGTMGSTYSVADGIVRGDDAATIADNAGTAFKAGAVFGGVAHIGGSAISKGTSKISGKLEARKVAAEAKAVKEAEAEAQRLAKQKTAQVQVDIDKTTGVTRPAGNTAKDVDIFAESVELTLTKKDGSKVTKLYSIEDAEQQVKRLENSLVGNNNKAAVQSQIDEIQKGIDAAKAARANHAAGNSSTTQIAQNSPQAIMTVDQMKARKTLLENKNIGVLDKTNPDYLARVDEIAKIDEYLTRTANAEPAITQSKPVVKSKSKPKPSKAQSEFAQLAMQKKIKIGDTEYTFAKLQREINDFNLMASHQPISEELIARNQQKEALLARAKKIASV